MTKIKVKVMNKDMLSMKLHEAMEELKSREERVEVLNNVLNHLLALDFVQQMEYRLRMVFWKCNYHIYDFLRVQGQLSRDTRKEIMQIDVIERYVDQVLEINGFCKGDKELLRQLLHRLYTAATMFHLMTEEQRLLIERIMKELSPFFVTKIKLKEKKRSGRKRNIPPTPPIKEKAGQERKEKNIYIAARRESFHQECLKYVDRYDNQLLSDFYNYWSEVNEKTGMMRFEKQHYWNLERRIKRWMTTSYASDNTAAALRLEKAKKVKTKETVNIKQQQAATAEREDANEQLFRTIEENKKKAVSYEEYLKKKNKDVQ